MVLRLSQREDETTERLIAQPVRIRCDGGGLSSEKTTRGLMISVLYSLVGGPYD